MPSELSQQWSQLWAQFSIFLLIAGGIGLISFLIMLIAWWTIFSKAGYSGAWSLLLFIPVANIIAFLIFAFAEWPVAREVDMLHEQLAAWQAQYQQYLQAQQMSSSPQHPPYQQGQQFSSGPQYPQQR